MTDPRLNKLQPTMQPGAALVGGPGNGPRNAGLPTDLCAAATADAPGLDTRIRALAAAQRHRPPAGSCRQSLWISLFFDGTGNNLKADLPTLEHSNVARMFRAHPLEDDVRGIYRIYIPGIGTLFPEIGDPGKGPIPVVDTHNGMGAMGQKRLDWAFDQMRQLVAKAEARANNPTNKIEQICLAVFGFSRGATLARAFVRDLLDPKLHRTAIVDGKLQWTPGGYPLDIRFMGLWDTVASVGLPMSANNMARSVRSARAGAADAARRAVQGRDTPMLRAVDLAFGAPGADPAPGTNDGHAAWADGLAIPHWVTQCVHIVAAHEIRNSFPLDSVLRGTTKPPNCKEYVYPGMHSDVGGGYRPGEGGKGAASPAGSAAPEAVESLSLVPLRAMYDEALAAGVPLLAMGSKQWTKANDEDFRCSQILIERFNHYMKAIGPGGRLLGDEMLAHMRAYYAWRWWRIFRGRAAEGAAIDANEAVFERERAALAQRMHDLRWRIQQARNECSNATQQRTALAARHWQSTQVDPAALRRQLEPYDARIAAATAEIERAEAELAETTARHATLPTIGSLRANLTKFDQALLDDVVSILARLGADPALERQLRPHYRNLVETYLEEISNQGGLRDAQIQAFFDQHVHDSLADFDKDATLPSDPRVIYAGGDWKMRYALKAPAQPQAVLA